MRAWFRHTALFRLYFRPYQHGQLSMGLNVDLMEIKPNFGWPDGLGCQIVEPSFRNKLLETVLAGTRCSKPSLWDKPFETKPPGQFFNPSSAKNYWNQAFRGNCLKRGFWDKFSAKCWQSVDAMTFWQNLTNFVTEVSTKCRQSVDNTTFWKKTDFVTELSTKCR